MLYETPDEQLINIWTADPMPDEPETGFDDMMEGLISAGPAAQPFAVEANSAFTLKEKVDSKAIMIKVNFMFMAFPLPGLFGHSFLLLVSGC